MYYSIDVYSITHIYIIHHTYAHTPIHLYLYIYIYAGQQVAATPRARAASRTSGPMTQQSKIIDSFVHMYTCVYI